MAVRHRAFMAPRLFASLIALGIFPVFLALRGVPSALEFVVLAWLIVPISAAYFLSRTGRYDGAHVLSALALTSVAQAPEGSASPSWLLHAATGVPSFSGVTCSQMPAPGRKLCSIEVRTISLNS